MPTSKKTADADPKAEAAPAPEPTPPVVSVTFDGLRATESVTSDDGSVSVVNRDATFAEQVAQLAPLVLEQATGIIPWATSGSFTTDGGVITLTLRTG